MNKTKKARSVVCTLLSFLLAICVVLTSALAIVSQSMLRSSFAEKIIKKSGYAESLHTKLYDEFVSYGNACNIDEKFFEDFFANQFTEEFIENDAVNYYKSIYDGTVSDSLDTSSFKELVKPALLSFAVSVGYAENDELKSNIAVMADELGTLYSAFSALPYAANISSVISQYSKYASYGILGGVIASLVIILLLFASFKKKYNAVRFLIYSFSSSALMLFVLPLYALKSGIVSKVNISLAPLYSLVTCYGNSVLKLFIVSALFMAAVTAILSAAYYLMQKKEPKA